jgi:S-formylglutathione hydrolase FrmB
MAAPEKYGLYSTFKRMKKITCTVLVLLLTTIAWARVDTLTIHSKAMQKKIKCVVITPDNPKAAEGWPVVYLLHGYSGDYANWIKRVPALQQHANEYNLMIVCPDGGFSSWYFDSPVDKNIRYETHIIKEVIPVIDSTYHTRKGKQYRAITGLSMGGHGGLFLGLRNNELFGACGSMSGGVDLKSTGYKFDIEKRIGDSTNNNNNKYWKDYSVIDMIDKYKDLGSAMIIDCGTEDFFYKINSNLHKKMLELKIPHEYIERPGKHDWDYWRNAVQYQLLFFSNYFKKAAK